MLYLFYTILFQSWTTIITISRKYSILLCYIVLFCVVLLLYILLQRFLILCYSWQDPFWYKLCGTTIANMTLGILKDKYFAQVFSGKPVQRFPLSSWSLFVLRDSLTIAAGFNMPAIAAKILHEKQIMKDQALAAKIAQIGVPVSAQIILTPIHLLALDFYNNRKSSLGVRFQSVLGVYPEATTIRFCRILCAYGIAGVANIGLRAELRKALV